MLKKYFFTFKKSLKGQYKIVSKNIFELFLLIIIIIVLKSIGN